MRALRRAGCAALLALSAGAAQALAPTDAGVYVAIDEDGRPTEKVFRVSQKPGGWRFEDRLPDGSWMDVSCHGGCDHRASGTEDLIAFFGAPPPDSIKPDCLQNEQFAFCHLTKITPDEASEGYVLVLRMGADWYPVSMVRLPDAPPAPAAPLETL